jgi:soluble lytic murein transglycosylase-like protein
VKFIPVTVLICLAAALPAQAQIYSWRDASGKLVVSNVPRLTGDGPVTTYEVPGTSQIRTTTRPVASGHSRFDELIEQYAREHGLSADLVRAVIQAESGFNPRAVSPKGAMGLMQLMPATARELGVRNPFQPEENIRGGTQYLAQLLARYNQNVHLALAAYNAGPASVERYGAVPPYRETQNYVKKITGATQATRTPPQVVIYKWMELVNGQPKMRYSNVPPEHVAYEVVGRSGGR